MPSDFNNSGAVNAADLARCQGDFDLNADSDADNDNHPDGADFLAWQRQLGSGRASVSAIGTVPEPEGVILAGIPWLSLSDSAFAAEALSGLVNWTSIDSVARLARS